MLGAVRAVCAPCERGVPLVSGRIALCIFALHQKPSDLKNTGGANGCGQLRIRLSFGFVFFAEIVPPTSVVAIGRATVCM